MIAGVRSQSMSISVIMAMVPIMMVIVLCGSITLSHVKTVIPVPC